MIPVITSGLNERMTSISAWKLRKKWTCAGCRMSMSTRMRSGDPAVGCCRDGCARAGRVDGLHGTLGHGEDASTPPRPGELPEVGDGEQQREHRGVLQLAALVGPGDQVGDVVGERLDGAVGVLVGGDLEPGLPQLAYQLVG